MRVSPCSVTILLNLKQDCVQYAMEQGPNSSIRNNERGENPGDKKEIFS